MKKSRIVLRGNTLPLYFLLAYALSWWPAPLTGGQILPYGPALAGLIVTLMTSGYKGTQQWFRELWKWRRSWTWYGMGPILALTYQGFAMIILTWVGRPADAPPVFPSPATLLELALLGGWWEEPGWTGYALPRLNQQFSRFKNGSFISIVILVIGRSLWHLPLYLYGTIPLNQLLVFIPGFQLILTWLYYRSDRSLPVVGVFHLAANISGAIFIPMYSGENQVIYSLVFGITACFTALILYRLHPANKEERKIEAKGRQFTG